MRAYSPSIKPTDLLYIHVKSITSTSLRVLLPLFVFSVTTPLAWVLRTGIYSNIDFAFVLSANVFCADFADVDRDEVLVPGCEDKCFVWDCSSSESLEIST